MSTKKNSMKNKYILGILMGVFLLSFTSCDDWMELDPKFKDNLVETDKSEDYYAALRAYKKSDHVVSFAWIGNISHGGISLETSYLGMPDSLDIVSIWQGIQSDEYWAEMRYCQQKLGTKFLRCRFAGSVPEKYGWTDPVPVEGDPVMENAIKAYANDLCDEIYANGLDGLDIDYEPSVGGPEAKGNLSLYQVSMEVFIKELGKRLGPQSGTDKILAIDGEVNNAKLRNLGKYFTYLISQAYGSTAATSLDTKIKQVIENYPKSTVDPITVEECVKKMIVTENFESFASTGGKPYTNRDGKTMNSLQGMALYAPYYQKEPIEGITHIAGFGAFHLEYEYNVSGKLEHYPYMRDAIQAVNPAGQ